MKHWSATRRRRQPKLSKSTSRACSRISDQNGSCRGRECSLQRRCLRRQTRIPEQALWAEGGKGLGAVGTSISSTKLFVAANANSGKRVVVRVGAERLLDASPPAQCSLSESGRRRQHAATGGWHGRFASGLWTLTWIEKHSRGGTFCFCFPIRCCPCDSISTIIISRGAYWQKLLHFHSAEVQ